MSDITIVDYGMGNLRSVQKATEHVGHGAPISSDPEEIARAQKIIVPGVGAFRDAIQALNDCHLTSVVKDHIISGRPFLGICLGLHLLFDLSYEDGEYAGLGIVPGKVRRFELPPEFKIPHMGWNQLQTADDKDNNRNQTRNPLLANLPANSWFYFVHSYYVDPEDSSWVAARTDYGGPFVSMIARDNVFATQFHPEKSQRAGLQLLRNFVDL